ncbi:hypothetical protein RFI_05830 [Reticulomyxa filosa]|uniref:trans-L-3-hydroxyproline dehydratase n=1 Tax=Reticulomyxa filosa TaxID=46433 RepID=X6NZ99_RETFI|nr:hypothetical protein RFI_05830 [Reticulomyxa filosa]|eukprot:ETO31291.1 hypothetical protein RFI_05830 [Reticulomyxa filosa]
MKFFCLLIIFILKFVCLLYIKVDRCPTGSGVIARMAADYAKNRIKPGVKRDFIGRTGSVFTGEIKEELIYKEKRAIQVEVSGQSNYLGRRDFLLDEKYFFKKKKIIIMITLDRVNIFLSLFIFISRITFEM